MIPAAPKARRTRATMDIFYNKIAGAVLGTGLGVMAIGIIAEIIYEAPHDQQPGFVIAVADTGGEAEAGAEPAAVPPIAERLQTADAAAGEVVAKKCLACHTFAKGAPAKVGPNLYNVVGGPAGHMEGFGYSPAMLEKKKEGLTWTFDNLDHFLANPKGFIPDTAMAFPGVKKPGDRANVIAYLRTLSDNPVPIPAATAAAAPAEGAAPAASAETPAAGEKPAEAPAAPAASTETPAKPAETPAAAEKPAEAPAAPTAPATPAPAQ